MFATATEDMDALTFGSTVVLRHLTASEQKYVSYIANNAPYHYLSVESCLFVKFTWVIY